MGRMLRVKTWELLAMALAGFILGASFMYALFTLPLEGWWRTVNASLVGIGQILVILAILRGAFSRTRSVSRATPGDGGERRGRSVASLFLAVASAFTLGVAGGMVLAGSPRLIPAMVGLGMGFVLVAAIWHARMPGRSVGAREDRST